VKAPTSAEGFLVITAINSADGEANSETFKVNATMSGDPEQVDRFSVTDADGEAWMITSHKLDAILPEVRPYRQLVQHMIHEDQSCQSPACALSMMGHLLAGAAPELVDLVKALDPDHQEEA
jgi:hypothetical protein